MMYKAVATSDDPASSVDIFAVSREAALSETLGSMDFHTPVALFKGRSPPDFVQKPD